MTDFLLICLGRHKLLIRLQATLFHGEFNKKSAWGKKRSGGPILKLGSSIYMLSPSSSWDSVDRVSVEIGSLYRGQNY